MFYLLFTHKLELNVLSLMMTFIRDLAKPAATDLLIEVRSSLLRSLFAHLVAAILDL